VTITSKAFLGKTRIEQHKMVYEALQGHMGTTLHALSLKTQIPKE
jgi:stress-induced morphogen